MSGKKHHHAYKGSHAVIYARYSSHNQTEQSIEGQLSKCYEYAAQHGMDILLEYIDREISGRTDARPAFQRMMTDSEQGEFDTVLIYEFDRFARNRRDSAINKAILKHNGVRLISVTQPIPDTPEGIMLEACLEGMDEYFSADLSRKVRRGMNESARKGMSTGGMTPLGYLIDANKNYQINEKEAAAIRECFKMYAEEGDVKAICARMDELGLRSRGNKKAPQGKPLNATAISRIVTNKKYVGVYSYDGEVYENLIPPIVDEVTFSLCIARKARMSARFGVHNSKALVSYPLSGKSICGLCGSPLMGDCGKGRHGETHHYYVCGARKRKAGACTLRRFRRDALDQLVLGITCDLVLTPENIQTIAERAIQANQPDRSTLDALIAQQKENEQAIENMLRAIEMGIITASTKARMTELEKKRESLRASAAVERMRLAAPNLDREAIIFYLEFYAAALLKDTDMDENMVTALINTVYVYKNELIIAYNVSVKPTITAAKATSQQYPRH